MPRGRPSGRSRALRHVPFRSHLRVRFLFRFIGPQIRRRLCIQQTTLCCQVLFSNSFFGSYREARPACGVCTSGPCGAILGRRVGSNGFVSVARCEDSMRPTIVAVGGFTSNSGKTTLVCELLRRLRGWEAIKVSRGHYRSCGRDPHACCVSPLLGEEPVVRSGRAETYAPGKDTGRYWDAGASEVHWAIVTDKQVGEGVRAALGRVKAGGVLIEGNSLLRHVEPDLFLMVARPDVLKIKPTARRALAKT